MASGATFHAKITADARQFIQQIEESTKALSGLVKATGKTPKQNAKAAENEVKSAYQEAQNMASKAHQQNMQYIKAENAARRQGIGTQFGGQGPAVRGARLVVGEFAKEQIAMEKQRRRDLMQQRREEVDMQRQQVDAMVTGRYALYDMASAYQQVAYYAFQVTRALTTTVQKAGEFETAFTAVERAAVLEDGTRNFNNMRDALVELSSEIPVAFAQITEIATLGAQMGVAASDLEGFTKTVAAFSAVTGASIDETAEKFGRISALAKVPVSEFENLASSVLFAGFNAVATEQEILSMSESIAAAASNAGYSAKQVIGLATALSSLGIAPEQARGVILRVFNTITRAIEGSTDKLEAFAAAAGMSAEEAQYLWKESPEQFFTSLLNGLGTVEQLTLALDELGITNTREINVIQRLSGNMDVYTKSLQEAATAYEEGSALQDIYAKTADNLEAKITRLQNAFEAFRAAGGETLAEVIKPAVDLLVDLTTSLTNFVQTPIGRLVIPMITGFAAVTAGMAGFRAVTTLATAQMLAMRTALLKMGQMGSLVQNPIRTLVSTMTQQIFVTERLGNGVQFLTLKELNNMLAKKELTKATYDQVIANDAATASTQRLGIAMRFLGAASVVAAVATVTGMLIEFAKSSSEFGKSVGGARALATAIGQDTSEYNKLSAAQKATTDEFIKHTVEVEKNTSSLNPNAEAIQSVTGASEDFLVQNKIVTQELENQTAAIGANTREWIANALIQDENLEAALEKYPNFFSEVAAAGYDFGEMLDEVLQNPDIDFGERIFNDISKVGSAIQEVEDEILGIYGRAAGRTLSREEETRLSILNEQKQELESQADILQKLKASFSSLGPTIKSALNKTIFADAVNGLLGIGDAANDADDEIEKLDDSSKGLSDSLRTVLDYASDLNGIFGRVIDLDFAKLIGRDAIAKGWGKIAENAAKAADAIDKAAQTQKDLAADKTILEYQLSVAERYGDELRAAEIRAKLAKVNTDLAEADQNLADAQAEASMGLTGTSEAAIDNRAEILGVIKNYRDYIKTLAELGRKPEQLAGDIAVLKRQFREQAIAAGYAEGELAPYLDLFDQFAKVTTEAPRDVDIEVQLGLDAAEQAVKEFLAKKRSMGVDVNINDPDTRSYAQRLEDNLQGMLNNLPLDSDSMWANYIRDLLNNIQNPTVTESPTRAALQGMWKNIANDTESLWGQYLAEALKAGSRQAILQTASSGMASVGGSYYRRPAYSSYLYDYYRQMYTDALRLADGGLVEGPGSAKSDSVPARLSRGEYVVQASAVKAYGVDFMNALNTQRLPMASSVIASPASAAGGSTIAYLAPEDRALLRAVADRPVTLYADNTKIAQSANAGNQTLSQRGLK